MQIDTHCAVKKIDPPKVTKITLFKDDIGKSKALVGDTVINARPISSEHAYVIEAFSEIYKRRFEREVEDLEA